jgi:hypothetical protein
LIALLLSERIRRAIANSVTAANSQADTGGLIQMPAAYAGVQSGRLILEAPLTLEAAKDAG